MHFTGPSDHGRPRALCVRVLWLIRVWRYSGCMVAWCFQQAEYLVLFKNYGFGAMCLSNISRLPSHSSGVLCGVVSLFFLQFLLEKASPHLQFFTVVDLL